MLLHRDDTLPMTAATVYQGVALAWLVSVLLAWFANPSLFNRAAFTDIWMQSIRSARLTFGGFQAGTDQLAQSTAAVPGSAGGQHLAPQSKSGFQHMGVATGAVTVTVILEPHGPWRITIDFAS